MKPTLRERLRWWRWFLAVPGPATFLRWPGRYPDRATRALIRARHDAIEAWPRVRQGKWIYH